MFSGLTQAQSDRLAALIEKADARLSKRAGYKISDISRNAELLAKDRVEVGWREACGCTDYTAHVYAEWLKVIAMLKKFGVKITEERQKHGNRYATNAGGFWNSIVYKLDGGGQ